MQEMSPDRNGVELGLDSEKVCRNPCGRQRVVCKTPGCPRPDLEPASAGEGRLLVS